MTLLQRIAETTKLWELMLPRIPAPEPSWIGRWCSHPDTVVEHGIIRAAKKFGDLNASASEAAWRYASGVMNAEDKRIAVREV